MALPQVEKIILIVAQNCQYYTCGQISGYYVNSRDVARHPFWGRQLISLQWAGHFEVQYKGDGASISILGSAMWSIGSWF